MDEYAAHEEFLISVGPDKARLLTDLLLEAKPRVLVELGGYVGYSAILFADAMRRGSGGADGNDKVSDAAARPHVWSLEFRADYAAVAAELVEIAGLAEAVTIVQGPADESLRRLQADGAWKENGGVDVLFLDHVETLYVQDLKVCEELGVLKAGSLVLADNVVRPGAPDYREYVRAHGRFESHGVKSLIIPGEWEVSLSQDVNQRPKNTTNCLYDLVGRDRGHACEGVGCGTFGWQ